MHYAIQLARSITICAWLFALLALLPWGDFIEADAATFALAVGAVGALATVTKRCSRAVDEVYLAGKAAGRREVLLENNDDRVVRLSERRLSLVPRADGTSR